jgi:hypothetical protein
VQTQNDTLNETSDKLSHIRASITGIESNFNANFSNIATKVEDSEKTFAIAIQSAIVSLEEKLDRTNRQMISAAAAEIKRQVATKLTKLAEKDDIERIEAAISRSKLESDTATGLAKRTATQLSDGIEEWKLKLKKLEDGVDEIATTNRTL